MINDTVNKIGRLIYILNELDKGEIFLPRIANDLGVTLRTIQRDFPQNSHLFSIVVRD